MFGLSYGWFLGLPLAAALIGIVLSRIRLPLRWPVLLTALLCVGVVAMVIWAGPLGHLVQERSLVSRSAALVGAGAAGGFCWARWQRRGPSPLEALAAVALLGLALVDVPVVRSGFLRDLHLYLRAGSDFVSGQPYYTLSALTAPPSDPTELPFLYPPFTIPFFAILSQLPRLLVDAAWVGGAVVAVLGSLRLLGLAWRWVVLLFIWPPFIQGIWVGNVDVFTYALFVLAPWFAVGLAFVPIFKIQAGIMSLWLLRERRWRALVLGGLAVALLVLVTLPIVGLNAWADWIQALQAFAESAARYPSMRGQALNRLLPTPLIILLTIGGVALAFWRSGRVSLAVLGLASLPASPTLYIHGFNVALPGLLSLRAWPFWLGMTAMAGTRNIGAWWVFLLVAGGAHVLIGLRHRPDQAEAAAHPLARLDAPWPLAPT